MEKVLIEMQWNFTSLISPHSVNLLFWSFCHMLLTQKRLQKLDSEVLNGETTSVADIIFFSKFLSKTKRETSWNGASIMSTAYTRHFLVGCHAYV